MKIECSIVAIILLLSLSSVTNASSWCDVCLNGMWECGIDRQYLKQVEVPGLAEDPTRPTEGTLWYRREVVLPDGGWNKAVLELKGARFRPEVYVNGCLAGRNNGGMSRTFTPLASIRPGETVNLEIALASLKDVPVTDASYIPVVDQWRSNCSSCLWDDVVLHLYRDSRVDRVLVWCDSEEKTATLQYRVNGPASKAVVSIRDGEKLLFSQCGSAAEGENRVSLRYKGLLEEWHPVNPHLYTVFVELFDANDMLLSQYSQTLNLREFGVKDKQFFLNRKPVRLRGGSVVWHRWTRDEEARELAFDKKWFEQNVAGQVLEHGGNYMRFHLGVPPERFLDVCDSMGLAVQYEWSFFHGMPASSESLDEQYTAWFDMASRHPSILLFHPYNETDSEELARAWKTLDSLGTVYPPMVMEDRDLYHIHRYWAGMSENVGLYFNSFEQFRKAIMVDEFGGIYLDGDYNVGGYPMLLPAMKRWCGETYTKDELIKQQGFAYGRIGEYWRTMGAAGVAAFPILSSYQDGNHWYEGCLSDAVLKPVWDDMVPVWAEKTVSILLWDRDFLPSAKTRTKLALVNDSDKTSSFKVEVKLSGSNGELYSRILRRRVKAHSSVKVPFAIKMPSETGRYDISATLLNQSGKYPVTSRWNVSVMRPTVPQNVTRASVFVPDCEKELRSMMRCNAIGVASCMSESDVIVLGEKSMSALDDIRDGLDKALLEGKSIVMLSAGARNPGRAYVDEQDDLEAMSGATKIATSEEKTINLVGGLSLRSIEVAEGESAIHPAGDSPLWWNLDSGHSFMWNGMRGGLVVPAANMELNGLSQEAFISQWQARGADPEKIRSGAYYAYEWCGFYAYDTIADSKTAPKYLQDKVAFLIQDMPAMELSLPRNVPMRILDLHSQYLNNDGVRVTGLSPLALAGKNLTRTPVVKINFGKDEGSLVVSQLFTEGRLADGYACGNKYYPVSYDSEAVQMVLNMISVSLEK